MSRKRRFAEEKPSTTRVFTAVSASVMWPCQKEPQSTDSPSARAGLSVGGSSGFSAGRLGLMPAPSPSRVSDLVNENLSTQCLPAEKSRTGVGKDSYGRSPSTTSGTSDACSFAALSEENRLTPSQTA